MVTIQAYLPACCLCLWVAYLIRQRYRGGLNTIPGPWIASFTDLWRLHAVYSGRFELTNRLLHDKYGELVRVGPNCISVGAPHEIPNIYGIQRTFPKSDFYKVAQSIVNGKRVGGLFMTTDEAVHKAAKRPIAHAYALGTLLDYEPLIDSTSTVFLERLTTLFADQHRICAFDRWLQWYAFDVIGEMTFSRRLGFLEQGRDVNDMISILGNAGWYTAVVGQMPWLDYVIEKNWLSLRLFRFRKLELPRFIMGMLQSRLQENNDDKKEATRAQKDFLSKFAEAAETYSGRIPPSMYLGWTMSNLNAGSDTTAISLRAVFYFLLRHPPTLEKLQAELEHAHLSALPTWKETNGLPYLSAVIKEAMRLHTAIGMILERVVPRGGVTLCGQYVPEGTIVGCNPHVIHHDTEIYGTKYDVDEFRPERWLDADDATKAEMDRCFIAFGTGNRVCIGKNISLLEMYKLVPLLLMRFKITLAHPKKNWTLWNNFFVHQKDFDVYLESVQR